MYNNAGPSAEGEYRDDLSTPDDDFYNPTGSWAPGPDSY